MSLYTEPIGAPTDALFTPAELQEIIRQFADSTATYFANQPTQPTDIVCINVPWQSGLPQCSPKAEVWIVPKYVPVSYTPPVTPPVPPPSCTVGCEPPVPPQPSVPEPGYLGLMLLLVVLSVVAMKVRRTH